MSSFPESVLVVGAGISGLTLAASLGQRGVKVNVVEIKPRLEEQGGIGLSIMGNASKALATIGVAAKCVAAGMPADSFTVRRPNGDVVATPPWPQLGKAEWPSQIGISRAVFHEILVSAAREAGASIRCGVSFESIEDHEGREVRVRFNDGSSDTYGLLVGADGLYSEVRKTCFPDAPAPQLTGQGIWRAYARRPHGITTTQLHFGGPQGLVGICPISDADCYVYCMHNTSPGERVAFQDGPRILREKLQGYGGLIPALAQQIDRPELVSFRPLEWLLVPAPWFQGRVLLIGDAAHANPPNLAQGAAMGMEDAAVLTEELASGPGVEQALERFMVRRFGRAKLVVDTSREIAKGEAEHTPGFDAAAMIRKASAVLAEPY